MIVLLTQDIPGIGHKNQLLKVKDGFFMNYLQPKKLARMATVPLLESLKGAIAEQQKKKEMEDKSLTDQAKLLEGKEIVLSARASEKGTLFRALTEKEIVAALKNQCQIMVGKSDVMTPHLKKVGKHEVIIKRGDREATIIIKVEAKASQNL